MKHLPFACQTGGVMPRESRFDLNDLIDRLIQFDNRLYETMQTISESGLDNSTPSLFQSLRGDYD